MLKFNIEIISMFISKSLYSTYEAGYTIWECFNQYVKKINKKKKISEGSPDIGPPLSNKIIRIV